MVLIRKFIKCPSCGNKVYRVSGLYRCDCGWSPRIHVHDEHIVKSLSGDRDTILFEQTMETKPIDGKPISLDHRLCY